MPKNPYLICVVDNDEEAQFRLWYTFSQTQPDCVLYVFTDGNELLGHLADTQDRPDLIVLDMVVMAANGPATLMALKADVRLKSVPVALMGYPASFSAWGYSPRADTWLTCPRNHGETVQAVERLRLLWDPVGRSGRVARQRESVNVSRRVR